MTAYNRPFWRRLAQAAAKPATARAAASAHTAPAGLVSPMRPLALEQRFMFDGAGAADAAHAVTDGASYGADAVDGAHAFALALQSVPQAVEVRSANPALDGGKKEVVLVDTSLADYQTLVAGVRDGVGIVEFNGSADGLAQIAAWAAQQGGYDTIHILSHGSEGALLLGTTRLDNAALADNHTQAELAQLGRALSADGDLLLYGCDVGDNGTLLAGLAQATGADVAASTDLTGAARLGGNWTLEAQVGAIDSRELALAQYDGVLDTIHFTYGADANDTVPVPVINRTIGGQAFTFSALEIYDYNDGLGIYALAADHTSVALTISVAAGYSFDLTSFRAQGFTSSGTITVTFANSNTPLTFGFSGIGTAGVLQTISSFGPPLNDVRSVTISASDYTTLQDIVITDVKQAPPVAVADNVTMKYDSGAAGDFVTNVAGQEFSGTLTVPLDTGAHVQVSYDNGANWRNASDYTVGSNAWKDTGVTIAGSNTFQVRTISASGVASTAHTQAYQLDQSAPTTSFSSYSFSVDTGASVTDLITKIASQTIGATLSSPLDSGDTVWASTDNGANWTNVTSKVSGTTLTWTGATLSAAGTQVLQLKVTDQAGNDGNASSKAYVLDTTAPGTTVSTLAFSNDSNIAGDFYTNIASQTVSGTLSANVASGETVYVSLDNGATWTAATAAVGQNTFSLSGCTLTFSNTLKVKVSDLAGNDGTTLAQAYVYDTTAPLHSATDWALSADNGASQTDFITNVASQTVTVTLSTTLGAYETVYGSTDGGTSWSDITSKVSGNIVTWTGVTLSGSNSLQVKVLDQAGNSGSVQSKAYVLDTGTPATPPVPTLDSDTGISASDGVTGDSTPTLSGTAEDGSTVTIYDGATKLGTTVATGGVWSYTSGTLADGSHTMTVTATDVAGNISAASAGKVVSIDTGAATVASVSVPASATYYSGEALDFSVHYNEAVYVDTSVGTPRISLDVGGVTRYASYVSGSGSSTLVFRYIVVNGDTDANGITVTGLSANNGTLTDLAGNASTTTLNSTGSTTGVLVDGSQPSITNVSASTANGSYGEGSTISITVSFSTAVEVNTTGGIPTLALSSGGTATYFSGGGSNTLVFHYTVGAGENSADLDYASSAALSLNSALIYESGGSGRNASVALLTPGAAGSLGANRNLVIDTTAPTITGAALVFSDDTGSSSTDLITKQAGQTEIHGTLDGALGAGEVVKVSLDNGASWLTATAAGSNWSIGGRALSGSNTALVRVIDAAGNIGGTASFGYVLDQSAPNTSFGTIGLSNDSGSSNTDLITNTAAQTISATLSSVLASGEQVFGSLDGGNSWSDITSKVSGTTLTWNGVTLASSNMLQFYVRDVAGNHGAITSMPYVLDTMPPTTSIASIMFSDDSGSSNSDFITKFGTQTISGTLSASLQAGEAIYVSTDNGGSWHIATSNGPASWSIANMTLSAGTDTLLVKASDISGNDGTILSQGYTYDITPPAAATVTPLQTPSLTPVLSGSATLAAGDRLTVSVGGATYSVIPVAGAWSLDLATAVPASGSLALALNQQYSVVATITDAAGNSSNDSSADLLIDGVVPSVASVSVPAAGDYKAGDVLTFTVNVSEGVLTNGLPRLTLDVGGVTRYATLVPGGNGSTLVFEYTVQAGDNDADGIRIGGSLDLNGGSVRDASGNALNLALNSVDSTAAVRVDTTAPAAVSMLLDKNLLNAQETAQLTIRFSEAVKGLNVADFTVTDGTLSDLVSTDGGITWTATLTPAAGKVQSHLQVVLNHTGYTDLAGNAAASDSLSGSYAIDTVLPAQPVLEVERNAAGSATVRVDALEAGAQWEYSLDAGQTWQTGQGNVVAIASPGQYLLQVRQTNAVGNRSEVAALTVDVAPLVVPPTVEWPVAGIFGNAGVWEIALPSTGAVPFGSVATEPVAPRASGAFLGNDGAPSGALATSPFFNADVATDRSELSLGFLGFAPSRSGEVPGAPAALGVDAGSGTASDRLVLLHPVDAVVADTGRQVDWKVPPTMFGHSDPLANVQFAMTQADGRPLPAWLKFDAHTGQVSGTMPPGFQGELTLRLTARDSQGHAVSTTIKIKAGDAGPAARTGMAEQLQRHAQLRAGQMAAQRLHL